MTRLVVGCMTGTSIDSIDGALVRISGKGLHLSAEFIRGNSAPLGPLAPRLRRLADQEPMTAGEIAALSREFSLAHVPLIRELITGEKADLIAVHGQTVFHQPPVSWQMLTPAPIARELRTPVVFDLRAADLASGGQGAPITPIADWVFFRHHERPAAVVNLGGFCNVTLLDRGPEPAEIDHQTMQALATAEGRVLKPGEILPAKILFPVSGRDVCPCNHLLDTIARKLFQVPFDEDGRRAAAGSVNDDALEDLEGVLTSLASRRRSLGTGDELSEWVSRWRSHVSGQDLAATACEAVGHAISLAIGDARSVRLAGGGARNGALVAAIASNCAVPVSPLAGGMAEYREAAAMAVLGALCQDRVPITLPQVTGVKEPAPVAGVWVFP